MELTDYEAFLQRKAQTAIYSGFEKPKDEMCEQMFEWQKDVVYWALRKGRCALFEDCGLGKTVQSLQWAESVAEHTGKPVLIVCPLAVAEQTKREGDKFGFDVTVVRDKSQIKSGINVTNYEMLHHFDTSILGGVVLDESSILKNYSGKMRTEIIQQFEKTPYKLSCTATPAPNDYMELGNQAEFCGVMSRTEMLATYFVHDGGDTSKWRLKGHAQDKFWEWLATWAVVLTNPSDLGYDGSDFKLPPLSTEYITIKSDDNIINDNVSFFANKEKDGYIGIKDFRGDVIRWMQNLGFIYHSEVCIWKNPVTAMQRTKALGLLHKQLKKDSCMSRQGIPDYLVTFRKPGENPEMVSHTNESYPVSKWQNVASPVWDEYASPVWWDINQSDTLNGKLAREDNDERHICPLQLPIIERGIELWTNPGDVVLDPFSGIGSTGYQALLMGRKYIGVELKESYYNLSVKNLQEAEEQASTTEISLFDMV